MNKHLNNFLDKAEGLPPETSNKGIEKEMKRQGKMEIPHYPFTSNADKKDIIPEISENPEKFLEKVLSGRYGFGANEVMQTGWYKELGWTYDFRPLLKRFIYKQRDFGWTENYALDVSNLRKLVYGKIIEIKEL